MIYIIKSFLFFLLVFIYIAQAIPINKQNNLNSTRNNTLLVKSLHHVNKHIKHKKRCHYTDKSSSLNKDIDDLSATSYSLIKQQRVRDQHQNRNHNQHHHHSFIQTDQTESEKLYVNIGDTINLTCIIDTKEIDWHFKDNNLTTTILSYGLQLQVAPQASSSAAAQYNDFNDLLVNEHQKYKVTSDRQSIHMITVQVQGNQDEGSYQCVDSKSEIPVKKTIRVILSNNLNHYNIT
jgi:hypothetical protein